MAEPRTGTCSDWISSDDVFDCAPCSDIAIASRDAALAAEAVDAASRILFILSGFRYPGTCSMTVRPCSRCEEFPNPDWWNDSWGSCRCQSPRIRQCGCPGMDEIRLGAEPIISITQVRVDGTILTSGTHYRLDDFGWLVRIDGDPWPSCQDLTDPATATDTFEVVFTYGRTPPADGILGAKALACDIYQGCASVGTCITGKDVTSLVRQGVTLEFDSVESLFANGRTGIAAADRFLDVERYARRNAPSIVISPDRMPRVRRTAT
mgnify:CR=1 FL=1